MQTSSGNSEPRWHAAVLVVIALALYVTLPPKVIVGPLWLLPTLILVILVPLLLIAPKRRGDEPAALRIASVVPIALLGGFNVANIVLLFVWQLSVHHHKNISGEQLLAGGAAIWLTNVIVYALWFWELDGGGPAKRSRVDFQREPDSVDFLFPQMAMAPEISARSHWRPRLLDYVFVSFTNATALSPTDTYPLTRLAKTLMMVEAFKSLVTIAIIAGRAVNILGS